MTEVLHVPRQPDGQSFYQSSGLRRSPPSSSSLFLDSTPLPSSPKTVVPASVEHQERAPITPTSSPLSPSPQPSIWDLSNAPSPKSTPASSGLSLATKIDLDNHDIDFPNYDDVQYDSTKHGSNSSSLAYSGESGDDPIEMATTDTTVSDSPLPTPTVVDDTAVKLEPSRQVDFLSHNWREEDIWSSWRHIVSQRKTVYGERSRLENASWRTWTKSKYSLRTVAPERLNWLKESDVTWLYGPLKTASSYPITQDMLEPTSPISKNNSFVNKKPILKKRSVSEAMLQKSLSNSSLLKQAAASVQAQGRRSRRSSVATNSEETSHRGSIDYFTSRSTSGSATPYEHSEKRHIRFDDRVEQCIAVDCKDTTIEDDDEIDTTDVDSDPFRGSDSSSDDGLFMKKPSKLAATAKGHQTGQKSSRSNSLSGRKTIETLPATTLKYRTDSPDIDSAAQHHTFGRSWNSAKLSPSPSQETLRPAHPSSNFLLGDENEGYPDFDSASSFTFGGSKPKSPLGASATPGSATSRRNGGMPVARARSSTTPTPSSYNFEEVSSMRRTESGMLMPYDEDEDDIVATGLFGRVSDAIKTARDVSYVIWNVGWRT